MCKNIQQTPYKPNPISSHLQPLATHSHKPVTTKRLNAQKIYSTSNLEAHWGILLYILSRRRKNVRPICRAYSCQTPSRTFLTCLLTNCKPHPSHTESVIASISHHSFVETSDTHRKSMLDIVYSTTSSPRWEFCCAEAYRAACHRTDG